MQSEENCTSFSSLKKISYSVRLYIGILLLLGTILLVMFHFFSDTFYDNLIEKREKRLVHMTGELSKKVTELYSINRTFVETDIKNRLLRYEDHSLDCFSALTLGYYDLELQRFLSVGSLNKSENMKGGSSELKRFEGSGKMVYTDISLIGNSGVKGILVVYPIFYQSKVVGYAWGQSEVADIAQRTAEINKRLIKIVYVVFGVGIVGAYVINYYSRKSLLQFARDVHLLEERNGGYPVDIPELNPLLDEIIKNRQHKMYQAVLDERMATIAQLSAGLAHDIRNPLTSVKGFLQILEDRVHNRDQELIKISLDELDSINGLIRDMLYLVEPPECNFQVCDIVKVTKTAINFLDTEAKENDIQVIMNAKSEIPFFLFDFEQIKLLLVNIIRNAFEAIQKHGSVEITINQSPTDQNIIITITDNGKGFSQHLKEKIFDPLFTTKNNGSGLGLPICRTIIHQHNGILNIISKPDFGTTVHIYLPT